MKLRNAIRATFAASILLPLCALAAPTPTSSCPVPATEFAPGQVSTDTLFESRLAFAPDRNTIYWAMAPVGSGPGSDVVQTILTANRAPAGWTTPEVASFSGVWSDLDPFVTPYGERMYFSSNRPGSMAPGSPLNDIWYVERTANGWGTPRNAGANVNSKADELYPSADVQGNLYFASDRDGGQWDLYRALRRGDGSFGPAMKLPGQPNHPNRWEFNPEISPDGRTLLFATYGRPDSLGDVDIYVSHLQANGNFGQPLNLGPCVNSVAPEFHPTVLWDRKELYFVRVGATTDFYVTPLSLP
jgi:Tol biopolymer transport system component